MLLDAAQIIEDLHDVGAALDLAHKHICLEAANWYALGGILQKIKQEGWLSGHANFEQLCEQEFGFKKSKAYHLIAVHELLRGLKISWAEVQSVGWSKVRLLCAAAVRKKFDAAELSTRMEGAKAMTVAELAVSLSPAVNENAGSVSQLTFKPHTDQLEIIGAALDKSKAISGTKHDTVALEHICLDFLGGAAQASTLPSEPATAAISTSPTTATHFIKGYLAGDEKQVPLAVEMGFAGPPNPNGLLAGLLDEQGLFTTNMLVLVGSGVTQEHALKSLSQLIERIEVHGLLNAGSVSIE